MSATEPPMDSVPLPQSPPGMFGAQMRSPTSEESTASSTANLVEGFTDAERALMAATTCDDFDADKRSREPRMRRCAKYQGLYASVMKAKNYPWANAANVNLPVLTYPMLQVQGRLYDMLLPANGKLLYSSPTNLHDVERANITETFGNAYIRQYMPEMAQGLDDTLHQTCIYGSAFRRTYWNEFEERVASDWIPIADFVVMDTQRSQDPSMRDVPRYTLVQRLNRFELEDWALKGIYKNVDLITWGEPERKDPDALEAKVKVIDGVTPDEDSTADDKPRMVLEQHRKWRFPSRPDMGPEFDGQAHAVMITVDYESGQVLRVVVREEDDPRDHNRFERQTREYDSFMGAMEAFEAAQMQPPMPMIGPDGTLSMPPRPTPPPMPRWMKTGDDGVPKAPRKQRRREICFFTHYRAFPSEGFYGLGFGDFLAGLNESVNTIINQHIDGVTLQNSRPGIISRQMKMQRGPIVMAPGQLAEVDAPMGSLDDGIKFLDPPKSDPTTMGLVELLMGSADKLVASSDIMSGTSSGANRTAKETQILAEQMMMQITVLARRMKEAFRHELDKIWRCWGVFLPDEEIFNIVGDDGSPQELKIGRAMFVPDAHVMPAADPRTKTQRIDETTQIMTFIIQNPMLNQIQPIVRAATEDMLRALGGEKYIRFIPPPQPPQPPQPMPAPEEDASFLQNKPHPTTPGDDDVEHINTHSRFTQTPAAQTMKKEQRDAHEQHIRDHHAQLIRKTMQRQRPPMPQMPMPGQGMAQPGMQ